MSQIGGEDLKDCKRPNGKCQKAQGKRPKGKMILPDTVLALATGGILSAKELGNYAFP